MARSSKSTAPVKPVTSAKVAAPGVTTTKAPVKPMPLATKPAATTGCCGSHAPCTPSYEQIAQRAYEVWVAKGRPQGQDLENWQQAEKELMRGALVGAA